MFHNKHLMLVTLSNCFIHYYITEIFSAIRDDIRFED